MRENSNERMNETKERILATAERLFARQGIEATSLRQITAEAEVNLAAVNYHFQSKDELVRQVYVRRIRPMNAARLEKLGRVTPGDLDGLLEAFFEPVIDMALGMDGGQYMVAQFLGRVYTEPHGMVSSLLLTEMRETVQAFLAAFGRELPHLGQQELFWRMHFVIGTMAHTLAAGEKMRVMSNGLVDPRRKDIVLPQLKAFAKAGLRAPSLEQTP